MGFEIVLCKCWIPTREIADYDTPYTLACLSINVVVSYAKNLPCLSHDTKVDLFVIQSSDIITIMLLYNCANTS